MSDLLDVAQVMQMEILERWAVSTGVDTMQARRLFLEELDEPFVRVTELDMERLRILRAVGLRRAG